MRTTPSHIRLGRGQFDRGVMLTVNCRKQVCRKDQVQRFIKVVTLMTGVKHSGDLLDSTDAVHGKLSKKILG